MPGIAVRCSDLHDQHVAAVAIRDDLLLQILRRIFAAQIRFERPAQSRPLFAEPIAEAPQLRAGVVDDLAGRIDLATDVRDLALERGRGLRRRPPRSGNAARLRRMPVARRVDRCRETSPAPADASASSARPSTASASGSRQIARAPAARISPCAPRIPRGFGGRGQQRRHLPRSVAGCSRASRSAPGGVSARSADSLDDPIEFEGPQGA